MSQQLRNYFILFLIFCLSYYACDSDHNTQEAILLQKCGTCHIVPEPQSLTSEIWETSILPRMANYFVWGQDSKFKYANIPFYRKKGHLPMTDSIWSSIESYYLNNSIKEIVLRDETSLTEQSFFEITTFTDLCEVPSVTALALHSDNTFWSSSEDHIVKMNVDGNIKHTLPNQYVPTSLLEKPDSTLLVLHSGQLRPHNQPMGSLLEIDLQDNTENVLLRNLKRPVSLVEDQTDILIAEFGNTEGRLTKVVDGNFNETNTLHEIAGCYKVFYFDIDQDGQKEYITQCTQALEGVYAIDQSSANSVRKLIAFPPEYGLSDLDTSDVNKDGLVDLLVAIGDNADYSNMPKSFHGLRVYINRGDKRFDEAYRYDWYGTTQARFIDANNDSDIDIIACAYFPVADNNSIRVFINKANDSSLDFNVFGFPESPLGRWMTMDKADMDNDGDEDVIFGSFVNGPTSIDSAQTQVMLDTSVDVILLKNQMNN